MSYSQTLTLSGNIRPTVCTSLRRLEFHYRKLDASLLLWARGRKRESDCTMSAVPKAPGEVGQRLQCWQLSGRPRNVRDWIVKTVVTLIAVGALGCGLMSAWCWFGSAVEPPPDTAESPS